MLCIVHTAQYYCLICLIGTGAYTVSINGLGFHQDLTNPQNTQFMCQCYSKMIVDILNELYSSSQSFRTQFAVTQQSVSSGYLTGTLFQ